MGTCTGISGHSEVPLPEDDCAPILTGVRHETARTVPHVHPFKRAMKLIDTTVEKHSGGSLLKCHYYYPAKPDLFPDKKGDNQHPTDMSPDNIVLATGKTRTELGMAPSATMPPT
ncbi:hypothetical protein FRC08_012872 [Ceratobasidium sp. 394]|nr:hypothetical protein FRC08_012872 [Ceratobasidium sp. 394]KAG9092732.1 hypothetical protein FS749_015483 [Ceratobasidium sp. UAMH 11750]